MGKPSVATQKRLFAVSGNRCAYRNCPQPLVDDATGKVTARICHIKGNKPGSRRHDPAQTEEERQGYDNLLLMCPIHHDVIDADDVTFTENVLRVIKADHEAKYRDEPAPDKSMEELFLANVMLASTAGSVILSANQSGGQIAHVIHNNYGTAPEPESVFRAELAKRHLADVDDTAFAQTTYHKKMGLLQDEKVYPLRTTAIVFAHSPRPILTPADEPAFLSWADVNNLRYEPCRAYPFLPGFFPDRVGSALVWNDGLHREHPGYRCYTRYLALERSGWIEYGFYPLSLLEDGPRVYYARTVANIIGFLNLLRQIATERTIDPGTLSLGMGLNGIKGVSLECITDKLMRGYAATTPPDRNSLLVLRSFEDGPWEPDSVALEFAEAMLNHWEFSRPGWLVDSPEFEAGVYKGAFFRKHFQQW